jgi:hypothetical protein
MKKLFFTFLFLAISITSKSQVQLSVYSEISIVTADAGNELFEAFGHSAIRIKDPVLQLDLVYNYGIFDFNAPNFYTNFTKGRLLYKLGRYQFKYFLESYKQDKRWVKQQVLNLTQQQRQAFFMYLERNASPQNATYLYDPFFNNCASKLKDITTTILGDKVEFNDKEIEKELSFRTLMNREIHWNTWGGFGINLALGSKLDKNANLQQYMYLPDYVYTIFKNSTVYFKNQKKPLVKKEELLLDFPNRKQSLPLISPLLVFSIIALLGIFITYRDNKNQKRTKWIDTILLITTGLVGFLIVFLWFFTDHSTTPNNFNVLWAFSPNLIIVFLLNKGKKWLSTYFIFLIFLLVIITIIWITNIQHFPIAVIPLLILLFVRYLFLSKSFKL